MISGVHLPPKRERDRAEEREDWLTEQEGGKQGGSRRKAKA